MTKPKSWTHRNPTFTASYNGFVLGEGPSALSGTLSCTTTALTNSFVGGYPITCSGQTSTNYAITTTSPGTLHVIFAPGGLVDGEPSHVILQPVAADGSSVFKAGPHRAAEVPGWRRQWKLHRHARDYSEFPGSLA